MKTRSGPSQVGPAQALGYGWIVLAAVCTVCTLPLTSVWNRLDLFGVGLIDVHGWALALALTALIPLWFGFRRHRRRLPFVLGVAGITGLLVHFMFHLETWWSGAEALVWRMSARAGAALLIVGLVLNAIALARWTSRRQDLAFALDEG